MFGDQNRSVEVKEATSLPDMRQKIREAADELRRSPKQPAANQYGDEIWYRGCSNGRYKLLPSLLRYSHGLNVEMRLWRQYCRLKGAGGWNTLFEMQHYFVPTRLLDWTTDSNVALYFALNPEDCSRPSVYVLNPWILNGGAVAEQARDSYPENYADGACAQDGPLAIEPPFINARIKAQSSVFTVHRKSDRPIDDLCPQALKKIMLVCDDLAKQRKDFREEGPRSFHIFPDETGMSMALSEQFALKPSSEPRIEDTLLQLWKGNFKKLLGISECAFGNDYIDRTEISGLRQWLKDDPNPFAIVTGPAGGGKTNLLATFAEETAQSQTAAEDQGRRRLVFYFPLGEFDPRISLLVPLMTDFIEKRLPSRLQQSVNESDVRKMIREGRILLILDGLDEVARTKGEEAVDQLRFELGHLANEARPKIVLACRDHILNRLQRKGILERCTFVELHSDTSEEIRKRLPPGIPPEAIKVMAETLLFYGVFLKEGASFVDKLGSITSSAGFFRMLIDHASGHTGLLISGDETLRLLGEVAARMLESRSDFIGEDDLPVECRELVQRLVELKAKLLVRDSNDKYRFIHQAIREFVLAWNTKHSILDPGEQTLLSRTQHLDYESAETYQHLRELLALEGKDMDSVVAEVKPLFSGRAAQKSNYLRNYFEAVAMLGLEQSSLESVVRLALKVIAADKGEILYRAKYEAARCLARLHPSAPKPLCTYVTGKDWLKNIKEDGKNKYSFIYGFAARGFHLRERNIGDDPPEAIAAHDWEDKSGLTAEVIEGLMSAVRELQEIPELPRDAEFLYVNCSHALIRWLDATKAPKAVREVQDWIKDSGLRIEVKLNLLLALEQCKLGRWDDLFEYWGDLRGRRVRVEIAEAYGLPVKEYRKARSRAQKA